ncbi:MAG: SAM-dependent methyltransferase [Paludibacteraceae bacterium]|nr:SAM-dependent methyltransferase [Paludibacteraceae bacterium]
MDSELKKKIEALLPKLGTGYEFSEKEKELLRSYSGKGGSKDTTDRGILDEYYTPDEICNYMYRLACRYGYKKGNVLEPSCATGNMIRPIYQRGDFNNIDAFEINKTSMEICKLLYPKVNLNNNYFETAFLEQPRFSTLAKKTWLENAPYDLVIGNPPYGSHVNRYSSYFKGKNHFKQVEMFFLWKGLELLKSGGLLVYISSLNFMQSGTLYQDVKDRVGEIASFLDAYRIPPVFENTGISTDIIILKKK